MCMHLLKMQILVVWVWVGTKGASFLTSIQVMSKLLLKMDYTLCSKTLYHTTFPNSETQAVICIMARVLLIRITCSFILACVDNLSKQSFIYYLIQNISPLFSVLPQHSRKFGVVAVEDFFISFFKSEDCIRNQHLRSLV